FFFSSRRRHTRCYRDWSSDVCSSDLLTRRCFGRPKQRRVRFQRLHLLLEHALDIGGKERRDRRWQGNIPRLAALDPNATQPPFRSEERRVGRESRSRVTTYLSADR